ncbi:MAG: EF-hand domain-containing protein, partial [Limisphaerales bacterium]
RPHRPPPLIAALDANHDGVIDADEIANAPAALKTLDKNGDGKLTMDELMPPRPPRGAGPGNHEGPPPTDDAPPPPQDSGN